MVNEPRRLPTYPVEIYRQRWYCFHCEQHRTDANTIRHHLTATHDTVIPVPGVDYGDGEMVTFIQRQWRMWQADIERKFSAELDSLRGADDLVFEVGVGAAVEKGDWRAK